MRQLGRRPRVSRMKGHVLWGHLQAVNSNGRRHGYVMITVLPPDSPELLQ